LGLAVLVLNWEVSGVEIPALRICANSQTNLFSVSDQPPSLVRYWAVMGVSSWRWLMGLSGTCSNGVSLSLGTDTKVCTFNI